MTTSEAKAIVKAKYPGAVCCSLWAGHWHAEIRTKRNGNAVSAPFSLKVVGYRRLAWIDAAERIRKEAQG